MALKTTNGSGDEGKICFVIAPIGEDGSDARKRSDQVKRHIIEPACKDCGYTKVIRADDIDMTGVITDQIVQHVIESPLVIADLTDHNANVFYELAIRHMHGKPYVQMILKGQRAPFDVSGVRTVRYSHLDLDEAEAARKDLINKIRLVRKIRG